MTRSFWLRKTLLYFAIPKRFHRLLPPLRHRKTAWTRAFVRTRISGVSKGFIKIWFKHSYHREVFTQSLVEWHHALNFSSSSSNLSSSSIGSSSSCNDDIRRTNPWCNTTSLLYLVRAELGEYIQILKNENPDWLLLYLTFRPLNRAPVYPFLSHYSE